MKHWPRLSRNWMIPGAAFCLFATLAIGAPLDPEASQAQIWERAMSQQSDNGRWTRLGDMDVPVAMAEAWRNMALGLPSTQSAFDAVITLWPQGNVYYSFDPLVAPAHQKEFLDAANEWASFANLHFIARAAQPNYVTIKEVPGRSGGQSAVGMVGGQQFIQIGPQSWNRATLCHELGHTLGLIHEQQRSDRDSFVVVHLDRIAPGTDGNFIKLPNTRNRGDYDFLSVMHYSKNVLAKDASQDVIEPLPPYAVFRDLMGSQFDPVLSAGDRAGMATMYGPGPVLSDKVTNTEDSGPSSLRAAMYYAIDHPGTRIQFDLKKNDPGFSGAVFIIRPTDRLPSLGRGTLLDGSTQPTHFNPKGPSILINGALAQPPSVFAHGLWMRTNGATVRSLAINGFPGYAIAFEGIHAAGNAVENCFLGVDATGETPASNGFPIVGMISGAHDNRLGGESFFAHNLIGGSLYQGVVIRDPGTERNAVLGNRIGVSADGAIALQNAWAGVAIFGGARNNRIGGPGAGNLISGNGNSGIQIVDPGTSGNIVEGNWIGLSPSGITAIPNGWSGVSIAAGAQSNRLGGPLSELRNVVSGNGNQGIAIGDMNTTGNVVEGNYVGLSPDGSRAVPNGWAGVEIYGGAQRNRIGGPTPNARNVISGNAHQGVSLSGVGTSANDIMGNGIGVDPSGTAAMPNGWSGVEFFGGAHHNALGGGLGRRNVISGNSNHGVVMSGEGTTGNSVFGNTIGLDFTGSRALPNAWSGVAFFNGAFSNPIGDPQPGLGNLIASNANSGVFLYDKSSNITVRANSIYGNVWGGIGFQNEAVQGGSRPRLKAATLGAQLSISGSYSNAPGGSCVLDFYASPTPAQGTYYLGSQPLVPPSAGISNFTAVFSAVLPPGYYVTATATDPVGRTSAFSDAIKMGSQDSVGDGILDAWRAAHFGGDGKKTNAVSCAVCDPDHDTVSNAQEFRSGTDPNLAGSLPRLRIDWVDAETLAIGFPSAPGIRYQLQSRSAVSGAPWALESDLLATPGDYSSFLVALPEWRAKVQRFYRVLTSP